MVVRMMSKVSSNSYQVHGEEKPKEEAATLPHLTVQGEEILKTVCDFPVPYSRCDCLERGNKKYKQINIINQLNYY